MKNGRLFCNSRYEVKPTTGGTDAGYSPVEVKEVNISADIMEATTREKQYQREAVRRQDYHSLSLP